MGSGLLPAHPILPGGVVPTPSSWTQVFKVHGLGLVQTYLFHYRLEFYCSFRSLWLLGWLRRGLVRVSTSDMGKVPGGFGATGTAMLWVRFPFGAGTAPSLLFIQRVVRPRWFQPGGRSTPAGLTHGAAFLEDFWWPGLIPANGSASEYWVGSPNPSFDRGDGADVWSGAARAVTKHW